MPFRTGSPERHFRAWTKSNSRDAVSFAADVIVRRFAAFAKGLTIQGWLHKCVLKELQFPRGLKPAPLLALDGAAEAAPLQRNIYAASCAHFSGRHQKVYLPSG
jgi:hypothetical protein